MKNFRELYCTQHRIPLAQFERDVVSRSLHRHAKPNVGGELGLDDESAPRLAFQLSCDLWLPPASRLWPPVR